MTPTKTLSIGGHHAAPRFWERRFELLILEQNKADRILSIPLFLLNSSEIITFCSVEKFHGPDGIIFPVYALKARHTSWSFTGHFRFSLEKRMTKSYVRLDKNNAAVLLVDHQAGLLSLVRDIEPDKFKNNVLALGDLAKYFGLPTILTTSFEAGPNGPLVPELKAQFPDAPYIARPGNINAWDNEDFVKAVKATGKKQLIIAGVVTEVCVAFPALSAIEEGFEVFVVTDASGTFNEITRHSAWDRMSQAGAQLMTWFGIACELHRDWRNDVEGLAALFSSHIPDYRNLMTSYDTLTRGQ
jgi:nicotinamidase-related amidase